jgi:hypothetical protein
MAYSPLITFVTAPSPAHDYTALISIGTVILTQAVALSIFLLTGKQAKRNDREKRAKDAKKDVLLEVAPLIQQIYVSLAELTEPTARVDQWTKRLTEANGAIAKLTAVADDETLAAARAVMTAMGVVMVRLMSKRIELASDPDAYKKLVACWHEQTAPIPDLLADFSDKARREIDLGLDQKRFADGLKKSRDDMHREIEALIETVEKRQPGRAQNLPSGQPNQLINLPSPQSQSTETTQQPEPSGQPAAPAVSELVQLRQRSLFWEYKFLNMFLVYRTQWMLGWLIDQQAKGQQTPLAAFDAELAGQHVAMDERVAVLQALETHLLVARENDLIRVTDKGLDYARWRGPLPQPAASA